MPSARITGGTVHRRGLQIAQRRDGAFYSAEDKVPAAGGGTGVVNITTDVSAFAGTTTGGVDHYTLEDGTEGQNKQLLMTTEGEAIIDYNGTATRITLTEPDDRVGLIFIEGKWRQQRNIASATAVVAGTGDPHYVSHDITHVTDLPTAAGEGALAMGDGTRVNGNWTFAIGSNASATGQSAMALGLNSSAAGINSIAIGLSADAGDQQGIAIGDRAETFDTAVIAIGVNAEGAGAGGICIGRDADSGGDFSIAIGDNADALSIGSIAIGKSAEARGITAESEDESVVIGADSNTTATDTVILGPNIALNGNHVGCAAIGCGTGAMFIPGGTTAQRPTLLTGFFPFRFNSDLGALEFFDSTWKQLATI
jgi:hypothetical protein